MLAVYQRGAADGDFGPSCVETMDGWRLRRACSWLGQGMGLLGHGREGAVARARWRLPCRLVSMWVVVAGPQWCRMPGVGASG